MPRQIQPVAATPQRRRRLWLREDGNQNDQHDANFPRQVGHLCGSVRTYAGSGEEWQQVCRVKKPQLKPVSPAPLESGAPSDDVELAIMKRLELLRIVSRTAPMLGLVATMIPMGLALLGLSRGDAASVGENLVVAFSSVILALVAASITFFILTIRRRWLLEELRTVERAREVA